MPAGSEDPKPAIEEACAEHHCASFQEKLAHCGEKVEAGEESNCVEEFLELMHCVDHCTAPQLFKELK
ncbi:ubiquinol-cytochrome C reductase hinge domain-containing protein [Chytriomyces sp. MP71]|nr:ubiquinol-cytochrome C reductase hinge domain-containing protein [Chytriomyces sp. MP71]